jgi:hypothetical protein
LGTKLHLALIRAQWDEFEPSDVAAAIEFTRSIIVDLIDKLTSTRP